MLLRDIASLCSAKVSAALPGLKSVSTYAATNYDDVARRAAQCKEFPAALVVVGDGLMEDSSAEAEVSLALSRRIAIGIMLVYPLNLAGDAGPQELWDAIDALDAAFLGDDGIGLEFSKSGDRAIAVPAGWTIPEKPPFPRAAAVIFTVEFHDHRSGIMPAE